MDLAIIRDLYKDTDKYIDKKIKVGGWIRSIRDSKTFGFIVLNDGSYFQTLQVVYSDKLENFKAISGLNVGSAIIVEGTLVATPQAKQPFEIQADSVTLEGASTPDYPLQKKRHTLEYLRTITHLRPRTNTFQAVFRVRSLIAYAIHKFFQEQDFVYVHVEAPDECGHRGEAENKVRAIELIDEKILGPVVEYLRTQGDFAVLVCPDHPTPLDIQTHTSTPVPYVIYDSKNEVDSGVTTINEDTAKTTGNYIEKGYTMIDRLFSK